MSPGSMTRRPSRWRCRRHPTLDVAAGWLREAPLPDPVLATGKQRGSRKTQGETANATAGIFQDRAADVQAVGRMVVATAGRRRRPSEAGRLPDAAISMRDRLAPRFPIAARPVHIKFSIRICIRLMPSRKRLVNISRRLILRGFTPRIPMTVVPVSCIRVICHEHQCAKNKNCQLRFHDDVIRLTPLLLQPCTALMDEQRRPLVR
jgi:hypothetical protein